MTKHQPAGNQIIFNIQIPIARKCLIIGKLEFIPEHVRNRFGA